MGFIRYSASSPAGFESDYDFAAVGWWDALQKMHARYGIDTVVDAFKEGWFARFGMSPGDIESAQRWVEARYREHHDDGGFSLGNILGGITGLFIGGASGAAVLSGNQALLPVAAQLDVAGAAAALGGVYGKELTNAVANVAGRTVATGDLSMNFRDLLRIAAPALGTYAPQVFGAGAIGSTLLDIATAQPAAMPGGASVAPMQMAALPGLPMLGSMLGGAARLGGAAIGAVRSIGGRILRFVLPSGQVVSRKAAVSLAKQVGLQAAATALGVTAVELAEAVMAEEGKARRGRGITAAQLRTTTRTIGKLERAHRQVARAARAHVGRR